MEFFPSPVPCGYSHRTLTRRIISLTGSPAEGTFGRPQADLLFSPYSSEPHPLELPHADSGNIVREAFQRGGHSARVAAIFYVRRWHQVPSFNMNLLTLVGSHFIANGIWILSEIHLPVHYSSCGTFSTLHSGDLVRSTRTVPPCPCWRRPT